MKSSFVSSKSIRCIDKFYGKLINEKLFAREIALRKMRTNPTNKEDHTNELTMIKSGIHKLRENAQIAYIASVNEDGFPKSKECSA